MSPVRPANGATGSGARDVYLVDGTYELFRQFFGRPRAAAEDGAEVGATRGLLAVAVTLLGRGVTHLGFATDHVIESFRNDLWPGYKTGAGVPSELTAQFSMAEEALESLGVRVWPMVELEADDALAAAAAVARADPAVDQVRICSPDKDLAQCVVGQRVVQYDHRSGNVTDEAAVRQKYGVSPASIPDWLALVGDAADGYPGLAGWGRTSTSAVLSHYEHIDAIPNDVARWDPVVRGNVRGAPKLAQTLATERDRAELFRHLATLRTDTPALVNVEDLRWRGPRADFAARCAYFGESSLADRVSLLGRGR